MTTEDIKSLTELHIFPYEKESARDDSPTVDDEDFDLLNEPINP